MKNRIAWIDQAKGWALICVVAGHLGIPLINPFITAFHIPAFFLLAGLTFSAEGGFFPFLKKKARRLLIPYFSMGVLCLIAASVERWLSGIRDPGNYLHLVIKFLVQERVFSLWFLACLFVLMLVFFGLIKLVKNRLVPLAAISVGMMVLGALIYAHNSDFRLPWNADICLTAAPYFCIGYILKQTGYRDREKAFTSIPWGCVSLVIFLIGAALNFRLTGQKLTMAINEYGIFPLSFLTALCGIYCTLVLSRRLGGRLGRLVEYFGRNSIVYFSLHQAIVIPLLFALWRFLGIFQSGTLLSDGVRFVVNVIAQFAVLYPVELLFRKTKLRVCLGEPPLAPAQSTV